MRSANRGILSVISYLVSAITLLSALTTPAALAQTGSSGSGLDYRAPEIEILTTPEGKVGQYHTVAATIVDDVGLKSVLLHYRYGRAGEFKKQLLKPVSGTSYYSTRLRLEDNEDGTLEYYLQAEDHAGNVVLKGYAFDPLVVKIRSVNTKSADTMPPSDSGQTQASAPADPPVDAPRPGSGNKLYYVLGGLAVALLIGLAAQGGGDDPSPPGTGCPSTGCNVQLILGPP